MTIGQHTITSLRDAYRNGDTTPAEAIKALAEDIAQGDGKIGAYLSTDIDSALAEAANSDISLPLGGIPIAIKDIINIKNQPLACASKILDGNYTSPYDATVISRLRAAGAIPFGRLNMDEFAMGSTTENSALQTTRNPHNLDHCPGGSSGGSTAAVAADLAIASLGTDTGGSIRQPAAFCGCVGLKPTYGRVSRYGLVAFASSLDQIGPVTKNTTDAAILLGALSGFDPLDSTSLDQPIPDYSATLTGDIAGMRIGLPREYMPEGTDREVSAAITAAADLLASLGAEIVDISLPHTEYAVSVYYVIATAEASANLARFDGVRYGYRASADNLDDHYMRSRAEGFGDEVKRRILLGTYVLSSGYYDAYYLRAQKIRTLIQRDFASAFEKCDALISPTTPSAAFPLGAHSADPLSMYLADVFTAPANLAGICGISVPCGFTAEKKLPLGLQILGPAFGEPTILRLAHAYEQATNHHLQRPVKALS